MLEKVTFGADPIYLQQFYTTPVFTTNNKILFQFKLNNVIELLFLDVVFNHNDYSFNNTISPLTYTYNVDILESPYMLLDGVKFIGLLL
jgi:hypothetical protein